MHRVSWSYLRSCITGGTTSRLECLVLFIHVRETKINNLERIVVVEQQVLWFQVTMADATLVQVFDAADQFPIKLGSLLFIQACISDDEVKKFTTVGMLHDHEKFFFRLNDLNFKG